MLVLRVVCSTQLRAGLPSAAATAFRAASSQVLSLQSWLFWGGRLFKRCARRGSRCHSSKLRRNRLTFHSSGRLRRRLIPALDVSTGADEMVEALKKISGALFGVVVFVGFLAPPVVFILGSAWAAKHLLSPLILIGWLAVALDAAIFLPLSIFKRLRGFTGSVIFISSYVFGLVTWLLGFVFTF